MKPNQPFNQASPKEINGVKLALESFPIFESSKEVYDATLELISHLIKRAEQGEVNAIYTLGKEAYFQARHFDLPAAIIARQNGFKLIHYVAAQGHEEAMFHTAVAMANGLGTEQNIDSAKELLETLVQTTKHQYTGEKAERFLTLLNKAIQNSPTLPPVKKDSPNKGP